MIGDYIGKDINIIQRHNKQGPALSGLLIYESKHLLHVKQINGRVVKVLKNKNIRVLLNEKKYRNRC